MAASLSATTVFGALATGNQNLSLFDGNFSQLYGALNSLNSYGNFYVDAGSANAYAITVPATQGVTYAAGLPFQVKALNANTASTGATLAITTGTTTTTLSIVNPDGSALRANQIKTGALIWLQHDGTNLQLISVSATQQPLRSYLAGLGMSTAGTSTTMTIAAGQAADSTNTTLMTLSSSISKTTAAFVVGTGNGGLDTGAIANTTWYHFHEIQRLDTQAVDIVFSTSVSSPTLPTGFTAFRRIGSGLTNGSAQWVAFTQNGELFQWLTTVLDVSANNPGTAAVSRTLSVPTGVKVEAILNVGVGANTSTVVEVYLSDLSVNDEAPSFSVAPLGQAMQENVNENSVAYAKVQTNTVSQIRSRLSASDASTNLRIATRGWIDRRGRDA